MNNHFILNIKANENWGSSNPTLILDRYFFIIVSLGILNILIEFAVRNFFKGSINDIFIQISHALVFFFYPSYLFLHSWKKASLFILYLLLIVTPVYYLILSRTVTFYFSPLFVLNWIVYLMVFKNNKKEITDVFFGTTKSKGYILLGFFMGLLFCLHLYLVIWLSQTFLPQSIIIEKVFINMFLEAGFSLIGMEMFFRYFLCLRLIERNGFSFFLAASLSTFLFLLPFLANPVFNQNTALIMGVIYYGLMQGFASCWLAYKTRSILPSVVFGFVLTIFLSLIF